MSACLNSFRTRICAFPLRKMLVNSSGMVIRRNDVSGPSCRYHSNDAAGDSLDYIQKFYQIHTTENNGSKEYLLLPPSGESKEEKVASLFRHRNILFAARSFNPHLGIQDVCLPLVEMALKEAGEHGEQPQAIASLVGLSEWVKDCLENVETSPTLAKLKAEDYVSFQAVEAMATGIPREGHSVVGIGTYRDGEQGWKALAKEYASLQLAEEVNLYEKRGGRLVDIEHLADQNPEYLSTAGGAMARLFFL